MPTLADRIKTLFDTIGAGKMPVPETLVIPPKQCEPVTSAGYEIRQNHDYFQFKIDEIFLASGREWWATYDPMVVVLINFLYNDKMIAVPAVVGTQLFGQPRDMVPHGAVLHDTHITGPHPFRGGRISVSIILYKVKRNDYARNLLKFMEQVSGLLAVGASVEMASKLGNIVVDGLESILDLGDTTPIVGHRFEIDTSSVRGFVANYYSLINSAGSDVSKLRVVDGRLHLQSEDGVFEKFTSSDYVLYSVSGRESRNDVSSLPFYRLRDQALEAAMIGDQENYQRAKALLLALFQQMVLSPDLCKHQVRVLFDEFKSELMNKHREAVDVLTMSAKREAAKPVSEFNEVNRALDELSL
ncbi:hypothetical protein [Azospirillum soli]|uniref:hypothetical protein n=1 Tax=Azospirillum soli TaxID=1304799 RepID=UPI001AE3FD6F|nr:hypothetical protein [Azospirillum soli]MBP2316820.1 putative nucleic acid-binding Zn ribbon protein [Azospirillum soli]